MKKTLQIIHLTLVFLTPTVFAYLKIISKESDPLLILTNKLFVILSVMWSSYLVVELIKTGSDEEIKLNLIKKYRQLLITNNLFLWATDILLLLSFSLLCYQISFFRTVEFVSDTKIELYESNLTGKISKIGDLNPENISNYRVRVGRKYFLYKTPLSKDFTSIEPIMIPFIWDKTKINRIKLTKYENFEILH